jgi:hypothetical protein
VDEHWRSGIYFFRSQHPRLNRAADGVMPFDLYKLVSMSAAIKSVVSTVGIDDDISVRHFIAHPFTAKFRAPEGVIMRNYFGNLKEAEDHLRMSSASGQNKEYKIADLGSRAKIVPANAPCWRRGPEVGIVIDPGTLLAAGGAVYGFKCAGNVNVSLQGATPYLQEAAPRLKESRLF